MWSPAKRTHPTRPTQLMQGLSIPTHNRPAKNSCLALRVGKYTIHAKKGTLYRDSIPSLSGSLGVGRTEPTSASRREKKT